MKALEEFWISYGEIFTTISAAITLIGVTFNLFKSNRISEKAVDHTSEAEKALSAEHKALDATHTILLERTAGSKLAVQQLSTTVSQIDRRMVQTDAERKLQFASLNAEHQSLIKSAGDIWKFSERYLELSAQYAELQKEASTLREENAVLRRELSQGPERDDWEQELYRKSSGNDTYASVKATHHASAEIKL
ncbi:MAG: hypothetical protein VB096_04880 [Pseudoflavonifractor sp.]|nr:hypothetical protein [Pseudoflavonifractor sp.]